MKTQMGKLWMHPDGIAFQPYDVDHPNQEALVLPSGSMVVLVVDETGSPAESTPAEVPLRDR